MSVLIKGMEMPETCFECPFMFARRYCCVDLTLDFYGDDGEYTELKGRVAGCPLTSVPPHGRLIDADALEYHADNVRDPMGRTEKTVMWKKIEAAPTIIPASEEGE